MMLQSRSIPIYDDDQPDDWHTFLYKASTGSIKASDTLNYANMAYMVALTGDATSPSTMHLDDYYAIVREKFPATCSISSVQQLCDIATKNEWIRAAFPTSAAPFNPSFEYVGIWGRPPVNETALMNDAMLNCLARWSPDHYIECVQLYGIGYDSLNVVTGMLYLSLTWPA